MAVEWRGTDTLIVRHHPRARVFRSDTVHAGITVRYVRDSSDPGRPDVATLQASDDFAELQAEVTAARDVLGSYPGQRVIVDSLFAIAEQAPGAASGEVRPHTRSRALADSLADSRRTAPFVVLRLSKPRITGDVANVSVTVDFPDAREPGGWGYETVDYKLERRGATWRVRTRVQLGIT